MYCELKCISQSSPSSDLIVSTGRRLFLELNLHNRQADVMWNPMKSVQAEGHRSIPGPWAPSFFQWWNLSWKLRTSQRIALHCTFFLRSVIPHEFPIPAHSIMSRSSKDANMLCHVINMIWDRFLRLSFGEDSHAPLFQTRCRDVTLPMEFLGTCEDRGMSWCQIFSRHQEFI